MKDSKNTETAIKDFKAVKFMRTVRDKISIDFEQIMKYFEKRKVKLADK